MLRGPSPSHDLAQESPGAPFYNKKMHMKFDSPDPAAFKKLSMKIVKNSKRHTRMISMPSDAEEKQAENMMASFNPTTTQYIPSKPSSQPSQHGSVLNEEEL